MTDAWQDLYRQHGGGPEWLRGMRDRAFGQFVAEGFPRARKTPGWRHTSVTNVARTRYALPESTAPATLPDLGLPRIVLVDGRYDPTRSTALADVTVRPLRDALDVARPHLERPDPSPNGVFVALNTAMTGDGVVIEITANRRPGPLHVVYVATASDSVHHVRTVLHVGAGAEATVIEQHVASGATGYLHNGVTDVVVAAGASLVHLRLQSEDATATHLSDARVEVARDARYTALALSTGAALSRMAIHTVLDGPGAEVSLLGLTLARADQHHDHPVVVDHRAPHGTSRQVYQGILDGAARGVFSGVVRVGAGASQTASSQLNRNLLLSDAAHADSEPQLEIRTDDVSCSHGSAIGALDEDALFYLRARGVGLSEARRMLVRAFAAEVLDALPASVARDAARDISHRWLEDLS